MDKVNLQVIRESFGRVVYTHKTHEKEVESLAFRVIILKGFNVLSIIATLTILVTSVAIYWEPLVFVSIGSVTSTLILTLIQLSFSFEDRIERHRQAAKELLYLRDKYQYLIADITRGVTDDKEATVLRDKLLKEANIVYRFAPTTSSKAYKKACQALKINEELTFSNSEIDQFLPDELKLGDDKTDQ